MHWTRESSFPGIRLWLSGGGAGISDDGSGSERRNRNSDGGDSRDRFLDVHN
jgi:hypothetical protein